LSTTSKNMVDLPEEQELFLPGFKGPSPADQWDRNSARRALDDLFNNARQYKSSGEFRALIDFIARFRFYSPFNAMLIHTQMTGAHYVAPAYRWKRDYKRRVKVGARPIAILQPKGPIMFVFDVADTEPLPNAPPLPPEIECPFEVHHGRVGSELVHTNENAKRDGVNVIETKEGAQSAGSIRSADPGSYLEALIRLKPEPKYAQVPRRYDLIINSSLSPEARYATLVHELAHLYCGHLGSPFPGWWPDRRGLELSVREFEAESVCYLVCSRLGISTPSDQYLATYLENNAQIPAISFDRVMKSAGLIEDMAEQRLPLRRDSKKAPLFPTAQSLADAEDKVMAKGGWGPKDHQKQPAPQKPSE